jgi:hypothetical protein
VSDTAKISLVPLGEPDAEVCVDGVCEVPAPQTGSEMSA